MASPPSLLPHSAFDLPAPSSAASSTLSDRLGRRSLLPPSSASKSPLSAPTDGRQPPRTASRSPLTSSTSRRRPTRTPPRPDGKPRSCLWSLSPLGVRPLAASPLPLTSPPLHVSLLLRSDTTPRSRVASLGSHSPFEPLLPSLRLPRTLAPSNSWTLTLSTLGRPSVSGQKMMMIFPLLPEDGSAPPSLPTSRRGRR